MDMIILGAGGHGRVVLDVIRQEARHHPVGFLDNNTDLHGGRVDGLPVLGGLEQLNVLRERGIGAAIIAIGDNGARREFGESLAGKGFEVLSAVHPSAQLASSVSLGRGVVIAAGALVFAHCQIGDYALLTTGCIVDHESMIGTATHICPGARLAGRVAVESGAFVGIGATVIQNIRIGYEAVVGAGAVVIADVNPLSTVVGVPAREIKDVPDPDELNTWLMPEFIRSHLASS